MENPKQRIPLIGKLSNRQDLSDKDSKMINCFIEKEADSASLVKRFGTSVNTTTAAGNGLGSYTWAGNLYQVTGTTLYKNGVSLGTVDGTSFYQFTQRTDNTAMIMKNNSKMYTVNSSGTITPVTDVNYPATTLPGIVYLDGTYYVMTANSTIFGSALEDPTTWPALNFIVAQVEPDPGIAVWKQLNYLVAFGQWTTEFFYDNANATGSPLSKMDNAFIPIGCASGNSVAYVESQVFWIGQSRQKGRSVYSLSGLSPQVVSDADIDRILNAADLTKVYSFGIKIQGHNFYILTLATAGVTIVYDVSTGAWSYFTSPSATYFKFVSYTNFNGIDVLQHETDGTAYTASPTVYRDNAVNIPVTARTGNIDGGQIARKFISMLDIISDKITTTIGITYSDNDYQTNSTSRTVDLSLGRSRLRRLGSFYRRSFTITHSDNTPLRVFSADLEIGV